MVDDGFTIVPDIVVNEASVYHVNIPVEQVAVKVVFVPEQILLGLAAAAVGAMGVGVTVTVTGEATLLHAPVTQAA